MTTTEEQAGFVAVVTISVTGPDVQRALVDRMAEDVREWVRFSPGFLSATYHLSQDGLTVLNYARWRDEASYRESFDRNPGRLRMREAIAALGGVVDGPSMIAFRVDLRIEAPEPVAS